MFKCYTLSSSQINYRPFWLWGKKGEKKKHLIYKKEESKYKPREEKGIDKNNNGLQNERVSREHPNYCIIKIG